MRNNTDEVQQKGGSRYVTLAAKFKREVANFIRFTLRQRGMSVNEFFALMGEIVVRYMAQPHQLGQMGQRLFMARHMDEWFGRILHSHPPDAPDEAVDSIIVNVRANNIAGYLTYTLHIDEAGEAKQCENLADALDTLLSRAMPTRYRYLKRMMSKRGATSLVELLDQLIDDDRFAEDADSITEDFEDERIGFDDGRKIKSHYDYDRN